MKTIGLIGGMSWESSFEYYRIINETVKEKLGGLHSAKSLMYSVDFEEIVMLQEDNRWEELTHILLDAAMKLKNGGADFIVLCTNTMHIMAGEIENATGLKVLHIAEVTGETINKKLMKKVGLLGTKFTMEGDYFKKVLIEKHNIDVIIPEEHERTIIHNIIYNELCKGEIRQDSKDMCIRIIEELANRGAEGVILGCTEIPLLIKSEDVNIEVFDTTMIHGTSAVEYALTK